MFTITKNIENSFVCTLDNLGFTTFVFSFVQFQTKETITIPFLLNEFDVNNERYQEVSITEELSNSFAGDFWDYDILGTNDELTYTDVEETIINTSLMTSLEIGRLYVIPGASTDKSYDNGTDEDIAYNPED